MLVRIIIIIVLMIEMSTTLLGTFKKTGSYHEVTLNSESDYNTVVSKSAEVLGLAIDECDEYSLFRSDGTVVPSQKITSTFGETEWTIGRYLGQLNKTASQVRFGVGM